MCSANNFCDLNTCKVMLLFCLFFDFDFVVGGQNFALCMFKAAPGDKWSKLKTVKLHGVLLERNSTKHQLLNSSEISVLKF